MNRYRLPLLSFVCLVSLVVLCYGDALFRGEQFSYRDAAHFYYPLYQRVQMEWEAGRWPLWEPEENAGMPLLGNPTAAVLYPGKILYALFPYAWGARLYIVFHTILAFLGMLALMRWWGTSWVGSSMSALSYAFAVPILFQYCNIIFLVGAAWTPFGFRAVDRWLRCGRRSGLLELALILSLQTLGGDPQASYLTGVCAVGYALVLTRTQRVAPSSRGVHWRRRILIGGLVVAWVVLVLAAAIVLPRLRTRHTPTPPLPWMSWVPTVVALCWGFVGLLVLIRWLRRPREGQLVPMVAGLACAGALAGALAAAQLLPVLEFTRQSVRAAGEGLHDIYPFSLEPVRLVEFVWPNVFGSTFASNRSWLPLVPYLSQRAHIWVPSIYLGGVTFILALGALGARREAPWQGWLSIIAVVSLVGSLGEYSSPLWMARGVPALHDSLGERDEWNVPALRRDGLLRDGDGGAYWFLSTVLPGFRQFRYPSKLLSFTVFSLAALAGMGWDLSEQIRRERVRWITRTLFWISLGVGSVALLGSNAFLRQLRIWEAPIGSSIFGPFDLEGAVWELLRSLATASAVFGLFWWLIARRDRSPRAVGALVLVLVTVDLGLANSRYVFTVPQAEMETRPRILEVIEKAERETPSPESGPFRVHRMAVWEPYAWRKEASPDRVDDFVRWERMTIQPKYGIPYGVQYTWTKGFAELLDYDWFFSGFTQRVNARDASRFNVEPGQKFIVYPRRGYDLWNTRYFVLPGHPNGWNDEHRGYAAFVDGAELIYPPDERFKGPDEAKKRYDWIASEDVQVFRNLQSYPRSWIVHSARMTKPVTGLDRADREGPMTELLFSNAHLWEDPNLRVYNPRELAWVDNDLSEELRPFLNHATPSPESESVSVVRYEPQRVELEAHLDRPGLVILSDIYYPGWRLTIDGQPAPVYRVNRAMRGAAVKAGTHRLVYTYDPDSFRQGGAISLGAIGLWLVLGAFCAVRPLSPRGEIASPTV